MFFSFYFPPLRPINISFRVFSIFFGIRVFWNVALLLFRTICHASVNLWCNDIERHVEERVPFIIIVIIIGLNYMFECSLIPIWSSFFLLFFFSIFSCLNHLVCLRVNFKSIFILFWYEWGSWHDVNAFPGQNFDLVHDSLLL